jgi:hypothetical protein
VPGHDAICIDAFLQMAFEAVKAIPDSAAAKRSMLLKKAF